MAILKKASFPPIYLMNENQQFNLQTSSQGLTLYGESNQPIYQLQEPVVLVQGMATNSNTVHLVVLKTSGELCYILVPHLGKPQSTVLTKLDMRLHKYSRLILLANNGMVHIFYAHSHQAIPELWYIEHFFWSGKTWQSVHLGEVVNSRQPLYQVSLDSQGNLHFIAMTYQGGQSLLMSNRFHGTFHIWGNPTQTLKISREVVDMTTILTPDNTHHLFWTQKTMEGQFEVFWAKRSKVQELSSAWHQSSAPIRNLEGPWRGFGSIEVNGSLWLLAWAGQASLLLYDGETWRATSTQLFDHRPIELIRKCDRSFYNTIWLEEKGNKRAPLFAEQIGLPAPLQTPVPPLPLTPPIPAFVPNLQSSAIPTQPVPSIEIPQPQSLTAYMPGSPSPAPASGILEAPLQTGEPLAPIMQPNSETVDSIEVQPESPSSLETSLIISQLISEALEPLVRSVSSLQEERNTFSGLLEALIVKHEGTEASLFQLNQKIQELGNPPLDLEVPEPIPQSLTVITPGYDSASESKDEKAAVPFVEETINPLILSVSELEKDREILVAALERISEQMNELRNQQNLEKEKGFWRKWFS